MVSMTSTMLALFVLILQEAPVIQAYTGIVVRGCGDASREVPNLIGDIPPEHTITIFDTFEATAWTAALGNAQFLMIPEEEVTKFSTWLPTAYHEALRVWVSFGGHFILIGPTRGMATLETLFSYSFASTSTGGGTSPRTTEGASHTTGFSFGPTSLPGSNAVVSVNPSSPTPLVMYRSTKGPTVMEYLYWKGMVSILGFDWYERPTPSAWATVLSMTIANTRKYCANGFAPVGNTCIGRFDLPSSMGFDSARAYCQSLGSGVDMISVNWPAEMLGVWSLRGSVNSWVGLRDVEVEGTFKNVDGTTPSNTWWSPGEPNDSSGVEDCVQVLASAGDWTASLNDANCLHGHTSTFCEYAPTADFSCPPSFDPVGKTCLRLLSGSFTYTQAIAACESLGVGAMLGSIQNQLESEYSYMYPSFTYLGGDDRSFEGIFQWLDGSPFYYTSWNAGEPNDSGGEDCLHVTSSTDLFANWNDLSCLTVMPYALCRVDPRIPSATPTPTRTATSSRTPSPSSSHSHTPSPSSSHTHTPTHSATHTSTHTPSQTATSSPSATHTHTPSSSHTATHTSSPSSTHTRSQTPSQTPSASSTPSATASSTATSTPTQSGTPTGAMTPTGTSTVTATPSVTPSPTQTPSHSHTHSPSTSTSATSSPSATSTVSPTATMSPSVTPTHSASASLTMTPSAPPPLSEPAVPGEPLSGRLGAEQTKQFVLAGSASGVISSGSSSATSGSTSSEEEETGPGRLIEVTVSTGSTDEVLAVNFQATSESRRRIRRLNTRLGSAKTRLLAAKSPTAGSGSSAQSFPVTRLKPLSGLSCAECASCSFNTATSNMMLFDNEQLLVTLSSGGLSSSSNFNLVLEEPQFDLGNLSTVAAVNTTVNCASIKSFGFDLQETRGTVVVSASVLGVSHNAVLFLKHGYPPTPTDFDARMPFRKDARLAFSAQGPPLGSVARTPAKQGRYFVGVAADVANFEYDDYPLVATRSFLSCCNGSAPPSFSLVVELQDPGDSYETAILFPVVAFGGPLALFMLVALAKLWFKAPNSRHVEALVAMLKAGQTTSDQKANTRTVHTLAKDLVLWANVSQMRALLVSLKQASRRAAYVTGSAELQVVTKSCRSEPSAASAASTESRPSSSRDRCDTSESGGDGVMKMEVTQAGVRPNGGSTDAAITVMEAGGLEHHGVVLGAAPGIWWIVALATAAVTGPSFLYQYGLAFRAHQLGEANQCNYNYMCKRDIRIRESGIPAFNAAWAPIAFVLVGFFMCAYTFVEQRRRVPASELTAVHRRSPPYHMFYAAGMGAVGTGLSGSCFSLCPHAWLPASEMAFLALTIYLFVTVMGRRLAQSAVDRQKAGPVVSASAITSILSTLLLLSLIANRNSRMWNSVLVLAVPAVCIVCGIAVVGLAGDPWTHSSALWRKLKSMALPPGLLALAIGGPVPMRLLMLGCHAFAALLAFSLDWHIMTFFVADGVCLTCLFTALYVGNKMLVRTCTPARRLARRLNADTPAQAFASSFEYIGFPSLVFLAGAAVCAITYAQFMEQDLKHSEATRHEHERCRFLFYDDDALTRFWVAAALGSFFMFAFHADDDVLFPSARRVKAHAPAATSRPRSASAAEAVQPISTKSST